MHLKSGLNKSTLLFFALILLAGFCPNLFCQETVSHPVLTWQEVMQSAEKNNADLLSARFAVKSAESRYRASFSGFLPNLTGSGNYSKSNSAANLDSGVIRDNYSLSLSLQQSLFSGFATKANIESTKAQWNKSYAELLLIESQIVADLRTAFVDLFAAQEELDLLKQIRDRRTENYKLIELRYDAGRENRGSYLRAKAQVSQARFEVEQAERSLRVAQRDLNRLIGKDDYSVIVVTSSWGIKVDPEEPDLNQLISQTPSYRSAQFSLMQARSNVKQVRSGFFPSASISGSGRRQGTEFPLKSDSWDVGLSISYPIFSGQQDYFDLKQAMEDEKKAVEDFNSRRRQIGVDLQKFYFQLLNAAAQAEVQKQFLEAAEERAQIARAQYTTGLISFQDWDLIETDLINAQKQTLSAQRDAVFAKAEWNRVQGKGWVE